MGDRSRWGEVAIGRSLLQLEGLGIKKSRDREIAPTVGEECVAIGRYTAICRDREIAPTVGVYLFLRFCVIRNKLTFCGNCCILLKYLVGGHC